MAAQEGYALTEDGLRLYYRVVGDGPQTVIIPRTKALPNDRIASLP